MPQGSTATLDAPGKGSASMATYREGDSSDQATAEGFVQLWGLPSRSVAKRDLRAESPVGAELGPSLGTPRFAAASL